MWVILGIIAFLWAFLRCCSKESKIAPEALGFRGLPAERIDSGGDFLYNRRCVFLIKCHKYEELKD